MFAAQGALLRAVDGVSFDVRQSETLGLVGESGSGKSTTGRILVGLEAATSGSIKLFGQEISTGGKAALGAVRRRLQFVFQDPQSSLNPRMRAQDAIAEPLDIVGGLSRAARNDRVRELLEMVGLPSSCGDRFPHEFSGGQRQRIGIARALALRPEFVICDEPVSSLDVSMQAQIVNLLLDLQERLGLSFLFIAHDLAVVRSISTRVAVMYAGSIVEIAPKRELYMVPRHPYTQALLAAVPRITPNRSRTAVVTGELPSLIDTVPGCMFHPRCPFAFERCRAEKPELREIAPGHLAACHLHETPD
ncbi:MAG TPA: ABC transporter ATP-binding protein [Bradyrhizobium sp.]|nr:ABC transporter ATP-binding protein [Bradyrhizobium sp.]